MDYTNGIISDYGEPFADMEAGVRATTVACIANVACWTGRNLKCDAAKQNFSGDEEANRYLFRR